ncbi:unnamed protein product [marine sediment metagenome]|uniref:Uncharacterized protein n=1 Tax=marine sediment metagenome TaxID=412755 RepID=X1JRB7_9ZZZZ
MKYRPIKVISKPFRNQYHNHDIPIIKGVNQILFLTPYSKKVSLSTIKNTITMRITKDIIVSRLNKI